MINISPPLVLDMNFKVMTVRIRNLFLMGILLDFTSDIWMLPVPSRVFMDSLNMRHVLRWTPLKDSCNTTVLYSVQYQGDFERSNNGPWLNPPECQQIPHTHCDLTFDLASNSDYIIQVRAQCRSQLSAWTGLQFNRKDTTLLPPEMKVTMTGDVLQVSINKPLTTTARVMVWRKEDELKPDVRLMSDEQEVLHVQGLQEEVEYCVKAQVVLHTGKSSEFTAPRCVFITGPGAPPWKKPITVAVTVIAMLVLLAGLCWFIVHCRPHSCAAIFIKKQLQLPSSLVWMNPIQVHVITPSEDTVTVSMLGTGSRTGSETSGLQGRSYV